LVDKLLHIKDRKELGVTIHPHVICAAKAPEDQVYKESMYGYRIVPLNDIPDYYSVTCKERHHDCEVCGGKGTGPVLTRMFDGTLVLSRQSVQILDLSVIRVCRQLYEEGTSLLWTTNTFSFDDHESFGNFMASLDPRQCQKSTKFHIGQILPITTPFGALE